MKTAKQQHQAAHKAWREAQDAYSLEKVRSWRREHPDDCGMYSMLTDEAARWIKHYELHTRPRGRRQAREGTSIMSDREEYLGDGCYASFDGYSITLRAPREHGDHFIVLEPIVFDALLEFRQRVTAPADRSR